MNIRYPIYEGVYRILTLECSSKAIPLHRKKHVPTGRAVGEGISIQKENEGVKREICRRQC